MLHRPNIMMPSRNPIIHQRKSHHKPKNQTTPVHANRRRIWRTRKEAKHKRDGQERHSDAVDDDAGAAKVKARGQKGFAAEPLGEYAADDDKVRRDETDLAERGYDVECDGGADNDEGEESGEEEGGEDGVDGDVPAGADLEGFLADDTGGGRR
jgi:hypothetical protein